jgi:ACS family allantoate permease-like MFS transporter
MSQDLGREESRKTSDVEKQESALSGTDIPASDVKKHKITSGQILKHTIDPDEALGAFSSYGDGAIIEIDEATNRRLLRKIDWNLMPVMFHSPTLLAKLTERYR